MGSLQIEQTKHQPVTNICNTKPSILLEKNIFMDNSDWLCNVVSF